MTRSSVVLPEPLGPNSCRDAGELERLIDAQREVRALEGDV